MSNRPEISECRSGAEFANWYWLKAELLDYCRDQKLPVGGSKQELTDRIANFMDAGEIQKPVLKKSRSSFDWHKEVLTPETVITDSYKNTQNVRRFFVDHYGADFKFNIAFMAWMKANAGKTLAHAIVARREIADREKRDKPVIPASNQYNRYTRDFFAANPQLLIKDARTCWAWKRGLPGHNRYEESDLAALKQKT